MGSFWRILITLFPFYLCFLPNANTAHVNIYIQFRGVRLTEDIEESWEGLRHFIRDKCPDGTEVYILSGDKTATATLKLKRDRMIPLQTGDQHLRWIQYSIGKKKKGRERVIETRNDYRQQSGYSKKKTTGKTIVRVPEAGIEDSWV